MNTYGLLSGMRPDSAEASLDISNAVTSASDSRSL